jgi:hypothetical protein
LSEQKGDFLISKVIISLSEQKGNFLLANVIISLGVQKGNFLHYITLDSTLKVA